MALAKFELEELPERSDGWGPGTFVGDEHLTFQQFNKVSHPLISFLFDESNLPIRSFDMKLFQADRIGRVADWLGIDRFFRRGERCVFADFQLVMLFSPFSSDTTSVCMARLLMLEASSTTSTKWMRTTSNW